MSDHVRCQTTGHFIRYTLLVWGWTPFCLQNCLNFGQYWHDSITQLLQICRLHIHDSNLPFHHIPKAVVDLENWGPQANLGPYTFIDQPWGSFRRDACCCTMVPHSFYPTFLHFSFTCYNGILSFTFIHLEDTCIISCCRPWHSIRSTIEIQVLTKTSK